MNRLFVVAGLAILIVALVFLNKGINKAAVSDSDNAPPPPPKSGPAVKVPAATPPPNTPAALPAEQTFGDPASAKHHVVIGWAYNEANQKNPAALTAPLQAVQSYVQKSGGTVSAEIVNTEVPPSDRSPAAKSVAGDGVFVDGKPVLTGDISAKPPPQVVGAIQAAAK